VKNEWIATKLAGMSVEEKAGQLLMIGSFDLEPSSIPTTLDRVNRFNLGGLFEFQKSLRVKRDCNEALQSAMKVPLFIAGDLESGPGYLFEGGTLLPRQMARAAGGTEKTEYEAGRLTAIQARAAGINMTASPVLDVHVNPHYPDGNIRAYSDDVGLVTRLGLAYIRGLQEHGMAAIAKHFPGTGSVDTDQHLATARISDSKTRMEKIFLRPYREAIRKAGLMGVMVSHLDVPSLVREKNPWDNLPVPASISREIVALLLKKKMGFSGVAMTDAFNMGGINNRYDRAEATVMAVNAGLDIILVFDTATVEVEYEAILKGIRDRVIPMSRIDDAVRNILSVKQRLGMDRDGGLPMPAAAFEMSPEVRKDEVFSGAIAEKAVTVLRNSRGLLPLRDMKAKKALVISVFTPDRELAVRKGHRPFANEIPAELRRRGLDIEEIEVASGFSEEDRSRLEKMKMKADMIFLDFFGIPSYAIGSMLPNRPAMELLFNGLLNCGKHVVVSCIGDPYITRHVPSANTLVCTFDEAPFSQRAAVKVMFGEIPAVGRSPVDLPPAFKRGAGISV
jgi:beta-glucosidase-like glycosyl hydrolase